MQTEHVTTHSGFPFCLECQISAKVGICFWKMLTKKCLIVTKFQNLKKNSLDLVLTSNRVTNNIEGFFNFIFWSQIYFNFLMDDCHFNYITKLRKEKRKPHHKLFVPCTTMDPASPYPLALNGSRTKGFEQLPFNSLSQSGATDVAPHSLRNHILFLPSTGHDRWS